MVFIRRSAQCPTHASNEFHSLNGAAQLTLFAPKKKPSLKVMVSNVMLLSRKISCCFAITSNHFFLPTMVLAHSVMTYPFRPRCMNVMAYPFLLSDLSSGFNESGKRIVDDDRTAPSLSLENEFRRIMVCRGLFDPCRLEAVSSWAATTRSSRGIGLDSGSQHTVESPPT